MKQNRDEDDSEDEDKVGYIRSAGDISAKTKVRSVLHIWLG